MNFNPDVKVSRFILLSALFLGTVASGPAVAQVAQDGCSQVLSRMERLGKSLDEALLDMPGRTYTVAGATFLGGGLGVELLADVTLEAQKKAMMLPNYAIDRRVKGRMRLPQAVKRPTVQSVRAWERVLQAGKAARFAGSAVLMGGLVLEAYQLLRSESSLKVRPHRLFSYSEDEICKQAKDPDTVRVLLAYLRDLENTLASHSEPSEAVFSQLQKRLERAVPADGTHVVLTRTVQTAGP